jgi:hypothetical protein
MNGGSVPPKIVSEWFWGKDHERTKTEKTNADAGMVCTNCKRRSEV